MAFHSWQLNVFMGAVSFVQLTLMLTEDSDDLHVQVEIIVLTCCKHTCFTSEKPSLKALRHKPVQQ